jgi:hypothetical protein
MRVLVGLLTAAGFVSSPASADTLNMMGVALPTCALTTPVDGVITLQSNLMSWATTVPASIIATNTAPSTLAVTRASDWAASPPSTPATTFDHQASITGANSVSATGSGASKSALLSNLGVNLVSVSITGTAAAPFKAGVHTAQVTVTCAVAP